MGTGDSSRVRLDQVEGSNSQNPQFVTDEVTFAVDANANKTRTAVLIFKSVGDYTLQRVLKVTQDGVSGEVTIEQDEYIIPYKCPKLVISAPQGENPVDYDAVISESWITQDKKNSTANEVVLNIEIMKQSFHVQQR